MQIIYVWIEAYANIKNQGFNFSSEYDISYDIIKNELEISKNDSFIENLFGDDFSNITAIVGQNGSGKSSLLEFKNLSFYLILKDNKFSLVFFDNKFENIKIIGDIKVDIFEKGKSEKILENSLFIKYSPVFEAIQDPDQNYRPKYEEYFHYSPFNYIDLTTDFLLVSNDFSNPHSDKGLLSNYRLHETFIQSEFIFANLQKLPFNLPNELTISCLIKREIEKFDKYIFENEEELYISENSEKITGNSPNREIRVIRASQMFEKSKKLINNYNTTLKALHKDITSQEDNKESKNKMAVAQLMWAAFLNFFNLYPAASESEYVGSILDLKIAWEEKPINDWFTSFFDEVLEDYKSTVSSKYINEIEAWKNIIIMINEIESMLKNDIISVTYLDEHGYNDSINLKAKIWTTNFCLNLTNHDNFIIYKKAFFQNYKETIRKHRYDSLGFLNYEFRRISSGERAFLSQFSRIFSIARFANSEKIKNVILFIDEGELGMHPQWQKEYIKTLITTLPIIFKDSKIDSIQIIMATHSPLVISDLPVSNIVFLAKNSNGGCEVIANPLNDKKPTFGSNIHSLFSDSFFINDGLIGDFAKSKINEVIKDLLSQSNLDGKRKVQIKKIIQAVGEPIIKKKLMQLFNDQYNLEIDDRIALLENEINKLKEER